MSEFFDEALPVVVVPEGTVTGPEVLFKSPLPVWIVGSDGSEGGGGSAEIPARLGAKAKDVTGASLEDLVENGWYWASSVTEGNFGPDGILVHVTAATNGQVHQLITTNNGSASSRTRNVDGTWGNFRQAFDADGAVDKWLRDQLRDEDGNIGGSFELPTRLAEEVAHWEGDTLTDINKTGWYYADGVNTPDGNAHSVLVRAIVGPGAGARHLWIYDINSTRTYTRARKADGVQWNSWTALGDSMGAVDMFARDQMRYATWTRRFENWYGQWSDLPSGMSDALLELDLTSNGDTILEDIPDGLANDVSIKLDLVVYQNGTPGEMREVMFPSNVIWPGGIAPTITQSAGAIDRFRFTKTSRGWLGEVVGANYTILE